MEVLPAVSELAMLAVAKMRALSQTHSLEMKAEEWRVWKAERRADMVCSTESLSP